MKEIISSIKSAGSFSGAYLGEKSQWLTGQLLVAMPGMPDPRFARAVIYVCSHAPNGAMGLVVNRLFGEADFSMLLGQLGISSTPMTPEIPVQFGGPVEVARGFVLHSGDYLREGTTRVNESIGVTATLEILNDIAEGKGPDRVMMALGYTGWGAGQLEEEIKNNGWLTTDADEDLIFGADLENKWDRALAKIGVSATTLSGDAGHA